MNPEIMYNYYKSVPITGLLTENELIKEINSPGVTPENKKDMLYRLWTLRVNHFDMA